MYTQETRQRVAAILQYVASYRLLQDCSHYNNSKLICIATVHTECALTATPFEFAFSQSTSIGGLKLDRAEFTLD